MADMPRAALAHVLWIGGATDAGKTSVAQILASRHGWQIYSYDRTDVAHHELLAQHQPSYRAFLDQSLDERWVQPDPQALVERAMQSFRDRLPLVIADLLALPRGPLIVAEGFGFTPDLLAPLLTDPHRAVWLIPDEAFRQAAVARRDKPVWRTRTSDPDRARHNLLERDRLLAIEIRAQAQERGFTMIEVDRAWTPESLADRLEQHFAPVIGGAGDPPRPREEPHVRIAEP